MFKRPNPILRLEKVIVNRNNQISDLTQQINKLTLAQDRSDERIQELENIVREQQYLISTNASCDCSDWYSCGSNSATGDKLKCCNICGEISVR